MQKINFTKQQKQIEDRTMKEIKRAALAFHGDIVRAWPKDTGYSVSNWEAPEPIANGYVVRNAVKYAPVLWLGVHEVGGKTYGSYKMQEGGVPILNSTINTMIARIKLL